MESKHQKHSALIEQMMIQGRTLVVIAAALKDSGCVTTGQELGQWLKRRARRVAAAKALWNPEAQVASGQSAEQVEPSKVEALANQLKPSARMASSAKPSKIELPDVVRSASIEKNEPSEIEKMMDELAQQALTKPGLLLDRKK